MIILFFIQEKSFDKRRHTYGNQSKTVTVLFFYVQIQFRRRN